jgi:uncharacterized protein YbjT (DUF2867 family)
LEHPKLEVLLLDWKEVDQWGEEISANQVFCCLGTTHKKAGSMAAFRAVDVDLVVAVGRRAQLWCRSFTVVSSQGANPLSMWPYLKAKGDMEMGLRRLGLERLNIVRPGLLLGQRAESRPAERLAMRIMKSMMGILRGRLRFLRPVSDHKLAKFMIHIAAAPEKGIYHYENQDFN